MNLQGIYKINGIDGSGYLLTCKNSYWKIEKRYIKIGIIEISDRGGDGVRQKVSLVRNVNS